MKLDDCVVRSLREISFWEDFFTPFSGFCSRRESSCISTFSKPHLMVLKICLSNKNRQRVLAGEYH